MIDLQQPGSPTTAAAGGKPTTDQRKTTALALAVVAAACLIGTTFSERWLKVPGRDGGFGLRNWSCNIEQICSTSEEFRAEHDLPKASSNAEVVAIVKEDPSYYGNPKAPSSMFVPMGWATLVTAWLTGLALLTAAGFVYRKGHIPMVGMTPTTAALLLAFTSLVTGCIFVATNPIRKISEPEWPFWLFGIGTVLAIVSAQMLAKYKPRDPFWDAVDAQAGNPGNPS